MPFRHLAGHRVLLDLVARAAARGSLPPSLIFAGPDGVGKRLAALSLAQLFNCTSVAGGADGELAPDACGNCSACRRIARGVHADVLVIEPGDTGSIKVDQVRAAISSTARCRIIRMFSLPLGLRSSDLTNSTALGFL